MNKQEFMLVLTLHMYLIWCQIANHTKYQPPKQRTQHNLVELLHGCAISVITHLVPIAYLPLAMNLTRFASFAFAALFQIIRTATSGGMA